MLQDHREHSFADGARIASSVSLMHFRCPDLTNNGFADGKVAWSLFQQVAQCAAENRLIEVLDLEPVLHLKPYAIATIVAACKRFGAEPIQVLWPRQPQAFEHLVRIGLPAALGVPVPPTDLRQTNIRLEILTDAPSEEFSYNVATKLTEALPGGLPAGMLQGIANCIHEISLNAISHSESPIGCVVAGQVFPLTNRLEAAIVDMGITIRGHLGRRHQLESDADAIRLAVREGITGTMEGQRNRIGEINSGVGLTETLDYLKAGGGHLSILSGSAVVCLGASESHQPLYGAPFRGTLVDLCFNTNP